MAGERRDTLWREVFATTGHIPDFGWHAQHTIPLGWRLVKLTDLYEDD